MTYADIDAYSTVEFWQWRASSTNILKATVTTNSSYEGRIILLHEADNAYQQVDSASSDVFSPDVLVPYNIASRHLSNEANLALDGVDYTPNTSIVALPDLSSNDLDLAETYMGTISEFRVWDRDITDAGLVEATEPSLEPSLSLTFEDVGTNSFVVNDWSE